MAKVVRGVDDYKKEFLSIFNSLCGRHGRWEVWSDFIQLTAIDISNVTDKGNAPKRAADARNIAKKYSEDEIKRMAEMLQKYAIKYGIDPKYMHPHSFRHLFAIEFLKRNNNLSLLADLLGHSSVATTAIYTRLTREEQQNALDDAVNW